VVVWWGGGVPLMILSVQKFKINAIDFEIPFIPRHLKIITLFAPVHLFMVLSGQPVA
jgi:hypothetical protein